VFLEIFWSKIQIRGHGLGKRAVEENGDDNLVEINYHTDFYAQQKLLFTCFLSSRIVQANL